MSIEDDLYKEIILENYKSRKNKEARPDARYRSEGANPSCGDDLELFVDVEDGRISRITYEGMGCSICCASANLLCESLRGRSVEEAKRIVEKYRGMLLEDQEPSFPPDIEDLEVMEGVKKYPVRIKCALLGWNTFQNIVKEMENEA
ncbi:MAG: Fe-S cluster assembly sulfur transfer protein SufU [Spirochaetaceae bacterium]